MSTIPHECLALSIRSRARRLAALLLLPAKQFMVVRGRYDGGRPTWRTALCDGAATKELAIGVPPTVPPAGRQASVTSRGQLLDAVFVLQSAPCVVPACASSHCSEHSRSDSGCNSEVTCCTAPVGQEGKFVAIHY